MKNFCKIICLFLCLCSAVVLFASCSGIKETRDGRLDYFNSDMLKLVDISPDDYNDLTATLPSSMLISDEVVEDYITSLLNSNKKPLNDGELILDRPVEKGDIAHIFYEGFIDGEALQGGSNLAAAPSRPHKLEIGSGSFIDDFEDQLIGIVPNETSAENRVQVNVTFPDPYPNNPEIAGKDALFTVYIVGVQKYEVPELNEDTIVNVLEYEPKEGSEDIVSEYKAFIKENLELANESGLRSQAVESLLSQLLEKVDFKKIPQQELDYYDELYQTQYRSNMAYYTEQGYTFEGLDDFVCQYLGLDDGSDWKTYTREVYTEVIKKHMICHAIAQLEGVKVTDEDYEAEIEYYIDQAAYNSQTLTRDDVIETVGEYTIRENALYSKICSMLYDNSKVVYE